MREALLWHDPPPYFDQPNGYIAFDFDRPPALVNASTPRSWNVSDIANANGHFALVNAQLGQLRSAFGFAQLLGRAVVIPQFICGMDRFWAPHAGVLLTDRMDDSRLLFYNWFERGLCFVVAWNHCKKV